MLSFCCRFPARLQYDTELHKGDAPSDSVYFGRCDTTDFSRIPESCSKDPVIEKKWKQALACGWENMYEVDYIAWKALDDIEPLTKDVDTIGEYII